jgi:RNA polymerase sigma factor for flagellar operon FliA
MPQCTTTTQTGERETLLRRYLPLVRQVARRQREKSPATDLDDLVAWGTIGLLAALERYDPGRDTLFSTYARFRIRGMILDELRALDWVPRSLREKAAAVERTVSTLEARLGRPAAEDEVAAALKLTLEAYRALRSEIAPVGLVSLDEVGAGWDDETLALERSESGPLATLLRREQVRLIADAIRRLSEREQLLLSLYYRDELTMKEVGTVLGLTESRVSQLHTRALLRVRAQLAESCPEAAPAQMEDRVQAFAAGGR